MQGCSIVVSVCQCLSGCVGADQEHKTDEMHTALMEASMDGHVDVARLLLDHGAQVTIKRDAPDKTSF